MNPQAAIQRAIEGALSAPSQNRCYLPVQGSILIPSLIEAFEEEFLEATEAALRATEAFPIPKIEDFDESSGRFLYDEFHQYKQLDWSYDLPPGFESRHLSGRSSMDDSLEV
jgi:hypothetical protein